MDSFYEDLAERCKTLCIAAGDSNLELANGISALLRGHDINCKVVNFADISSAAGDGFILVVGGSSGDISGAIGVMTKNLPAVIFAAEGFSDTTKWDIPVMHENVDEEGLERVCKALLFEFPLINFDVNFSDWMRFLPADSKAIDEILTRVKGKAAEIKKMADVEKLDDMLKDCSFWNENLSVELNLKSEKATVTAYEREGILFEMLSDMAGEEIDGEYALMRYVRATAEAKTSYDKIKDAFECAKINGYGIVQPQDSDMSLEEPKLVRSGGNVGIKLKATAPSYHIVKIDVSGEVSPIMGNASQSEGLVQGMMSGFEKDPEGMWDTNVFGKSLKSMVREGLWGKVSGMHDDTKGKMRKAITRIVNEGKGGVICILL